MRRLESAAGRLGVDPYALLGLIAVALAVIVIAATYNGNFRGLFSSGSTEVAAVFKDARTVQKGDPVRVRGVNVGLVQRVESVDGGRGSRVTMSYDADKAGPLNKDARARVAWRTLLGGAFVINIDPGRSESGRLEGDIPLRATSSAVELDDITTVVRGGARQGLRELPEELARTMRNPGTLAELSSTLDDVSPSVERGLNALRGVNQDRDLQTLITQTSKVAQALDAPDDDLRKIVAGAAATVRTTAAREAELRTTIGRSPAVMRNTITTLTALDRTLDLTEPVVERLREPAGKVAPALRSLRPVLTGTDTLLARATPLLASLRPAVRSLASTARQGVPLLDELDPSLDRLDKTILPYMNEDDPDTGHTAAEMVGPALGGLGNVAAPQDRNGHLLRFPASVGSSPFYLPCQIYAANPDKTKLIECESLQKVAETFFSWDPLGPAPGTAPDPKKGK